MATAFAAGSVLLSTQTFFLGLDVAATLLAGREVGGFGVNGKFVIDAWPSGRGTLVIVSIR